MGSRTGGVDHAGPKTERMLVEGSAAGDQESYRALVETYQNRVYGLALQVLRSPEEAEEVAQGAFLNAWRGLPSFRGEAAFSTWLYRITVRLAIDRLDRIKSRRLCETDLREADQEPGERGDQMADALMRSRRLEKLMSRLSPLQRAAVTLYYYQERSVDECAAALEMPVNTVKTHLSRARAALRAAWQREEGGPGA
jgi:RNA polymerase sigma-70 factor, ECF subfamily